MATWTNYISIPEEAIFIYNASGNKLSRNVNNPRRPGKALLPSRVAADNESLAEVRCFILDPYYLLFFKTAFNDQFIILFPPPIIYLYLSQMLPSLKVLQHLHLRILLFHLDAGLKEHEVTGLMLEYKPCLKVTTLSPVLIYRRNIRKGTEKRSKQALLIWSVRHIKDEHSS